MTSNTNDPLLLELERLRAGRRYTEFASEIGIHEAMLRAYLQGRSDVGIESIAVFRAWRPELRDLIDDKILRRGEHARDVYLNQGRSPRV